MAGIAARTELLAATATVALAGCWQSYQDQPDGGADGVVDAEAHHPEADARAGADADVIHDGDSEADLGVDADGGDAGACDGIWGDPTTGYLWENPALDTGRTWDDAVSYCNNLALCGRATASWHLPDIDELRSLIRGCPDTMTGGACAVTDSCLARSCCSPGACWDCAFHGGPGTGGCYWDGALGPGCYVGYFVPGSAYWSSSSYSDDDFAAWLVDFDNGNVDGVAKIYTPRVRCVHTGP